MGALKKGGLDDLITSTTTLVPDSPAAAYDAYRQAASAVFLAGAQGLKYRKEHYELVVDLSKAGLSYIEDEGDEIVIGAMTPYGSLRFLRSFKKLAGGAVSRAISDIADKDVQRYGTLGGVISGKGFSVLLPIFLSLHVDVLLQDKGRMSWKTTCSARRWRIGYGYFHCPGRSVYCL